MQFCTIRVELLERTVTGFTFGKTLSMNGVNAWERRLMEVMENAGEGEGADAKYRSCVIVLQESIRDCMNEVETDGFPAQAEEISFFKHAAPRMYGRLFFYMKLAQIECWRRYNSREKFGDQLRGVLQEADIFLDKQASLCEYYFQGKTYLDEYLFIRRDHGEWSTEEVGTFIGQDFTLGSYQVSWIIANQQLRDWVVSELAKLECAVVEGPKKSVKALKFTGNKVDVVELVYALYLKQCFNRGKATLKDVMEWFAVNWGIALDGYHGTINDMEIRKKSRTKFLHELMEELEAKMDEKL